MAYGSPGKGQLLIWKVGYLGPGPIQVSLAHNALSASLSPFSNQKEMAGSLLVPPSSFSVFDSCQALPRTLHPFPRWGGATRVGGERLGPCQDVKWPRVGEKGGGIKFSGSIFSFPATPSRVPTPSPSPHPFPVHPSTHPYLGQTSS